MRNAVLLIGWFWALMITVLILAVALPETVAQDRPTVLFLAPDADQLVEGETYEVNWVAAGVTDVSIKVSGVKTSLPGRHRTFRVIIAENIPANTGSFLWRVPYIDAVKMEITITGKGPEGRKLAEDSRLYWFRPASLRDRNQDGIYIDLHDEKHQRLFVLKNDRLMKAYLTSGAPRNKILPLDVHPDEDHDHQGVFYITDKYEVWHSKLFNRTMPWAMRYWNGHFIHATGEDYYPMLGKAASHGCNRLAIEQAKELYNMTPVGTRVEIIVSGSVPEKGANSQGSGGLRGRLQAVSRGA